ncbi:hypothetical protein QQF64_027212 [Cirrhinus molitorella]|uniref:Uncharacterized protein n=1 Tax=Cirrhinus molitorella TaxID=172907 RepID=A0ABR3NBR5_9TELE
MATIHSDIPQCSNSNEPEEISQSEEKIQSPHCHMQMSAPLCTDCVPIQYPSDVTTDSARKIYKQKLLKDNPETLFADLFKTGELCNLIFFTDHRNIWHKAIINHYPSVKKEGICNGWKVKIREPCDPDNTVIMVNIYKNGTVMAQGNLKTFQTDYSAIIKREKALLSECLSSEQNTQSSSPDLKPTSAENPAQDHSPPLLKSIPLLQEHFTRLEMVQLRETILEQEQPTRAHHTELQQNSDHITQRLSALTKQVKSLQTEKESHQKELATLRFQLQDREHLTLEMRQQLIEEREQQRNTCHNQPTPGETQPRQLAVTTVPPVKCPSTTEKARHNFPNSKIILSTLLQRKDFHPNTINKINANISRHCALVPNVYLAHHPDLDTDCLYDHVHLYKNLVHILAKRLKDLILNRASMPRQEPHRQRLLYKSPTAPPQLIPPESGRQSYAQAVSGGVSSANAELHSIQHMLRFFPEIWNQGLISSIYKNGDKLDPNNYRGICVNSNLGKVFCGILNTRLLGFLMKHNALNKCQIGFIPKCCTSDHIFTLQTLKH